ncbi:MAG: Zn-ribbon domain-containing OB-fold protein [Candidatus Micrarchaeota archaeon]
MNENIAITWRRIPERYLLEGTICHTCKTKYFPMRKLCPKCRRKGKIEKFRFSGKGKIYSFSTITSAPGGLENTTPYLLAIVELDEGPKLTSQIVECSEKNIKIGDKVEMVFRIIRRDDPEGLLHYGYKFRKTSG